ncbi:MAG: hypothetical protein R6V07_10825 [Armatimonadota bacterium]
MHLDKSLRDLRTHTFIAEQFAAWLRGDPDQLVRSAHLLGGDAWAQCAERVVTAAGTSRADISEVVSDLRQLRRLLSLDLVDDPFSEEALRLGCIHPDHPDADEARLCAEAVERALPSFEWLHGIHLREAV